jgi:hypothetical protein
MEFNIRKYVASKKDNNEISTPPLVSIQQVNPMSVINGLGLNSNDSIDEIEKMKEIIKLKTNENNKERLRMEQELIDQSYPETSTQNQVSPVSNTSTVSNVVPGAKVYNIPGAIHGVRPKTDTLIIHRTEGHGFHPNDTRLTKKGLGAQITIDRKGNIHQIGDLDSKMWHTKKYNNRSLGIEITGRYLGNGKWEDMTDKQKNALANVSKFVINKYNISPNNIFNHAAVQAKSPNEGLVAKNYILNLYKNNWAT